MEGWFIRYGVQGPECEVLGFRVGVKMHHARRAERNVLSETEGRSRRISLGDCPQARGLGQVLNAFYCLRQ
jgi:hypothetical protein